jgi:hypothetical protein
MTRRRGGQKSKSKSKGRGGPPRRKHRSGKHERQARHSNHSIDSSVLKKSAEATAKALKHWAEESEALIAHNKAHPFVPTELNLDPWQKEAVDQLVQGHSVIVDAPTTAGKTRVVESFFEKNIKTPGFRAAYTTPVKSLSNDKLREFRAMFGAENVGIATGDIKENLGAPIVVATLESYRNSLLGVEPDLGRSLVVFDEYHYLQDAGRGSAWEEAIILTPPHCQLLMLSASVENGAQFCSWINKLGPNRNCTLVRTVERPVPLANMVWVEDGWYLADTLPPEVLKHLDRHLLAMPLKPEKLVERLVPLIELGLTPTIAYAGRRLSCEQLARAIARAVPPLPEEQREKIGATLLQADQECGSLKFIPQSFRNMLQTYGVGFHHSGLPAPARIAIEMLIKDGQLRFCTATMGLSLGINFAVRSAIISDYKRPGELGFVAYSPSEVLQMLGRAGRRGRDVVGYSLWSTPEAMKKLAAKKREDVFSRLRNDPTTFLGLIGRGFGLRAIETFYGKSFLRFQDPSTDQSLITKKRLAKRFPNAQIPCASPAADAARYWYEVGDSRCGECPLQDPCHKFLEAKLQSPLASLHVHLHAIEAIELDESLTKFGNIARYFPQNGGLLIAEMISEGTITPDNLGSTCELFATLALARFKEPGCDRNYKPPFDPEELEEALIGMYPEELFPELYDPPYGNRTESIIKEFNPNSGYLIKEWVQGVTWKQLTDDVTTERYGPGDCMALIYRVATYLQSVSQMGPELKEDIGEAKLKEFHTQARLLRDELLREPLSFALNV